MAGCSSLCFNNYSEVTRCYGINCCQTTIPFYLDNYYVNITGLEDQNGITACRSAFLMEENWFLDNFLDPFQSIDTSFIPVVLSWTFTEEAKKIAISMS